MRPAATIRLPPSLSDPRPRREDFRRGANYLLALGSELARAPLRWTARRWSGGIAPTPPPDWRNGVILGPAHIGDVLYNTAALPALRAGLPGCRWTYVATESSAEVLRGNPNLDEVLALDDSGRSARSRELLAARKFDVALAYAGGLSWRDLLLAARLGIPNRIGYVHKGFSGLVTHPVSIHVPQPFPAYFRDLVSQVIGRPAGEIPALRPLVYPGPEHEAAVDRLSSDWGLDWQAGPVLACAVTSRQESGIWPAESFLESIRHVRDRLPCAVIYFGARSDLERLNRLAGRTGPHTFVCAGNLDLRAVVALLRRCRVALTTDSGPRHLANAAGTPVVFVRNISFRAEEAGAYGETDHDMAPREWELVAPADQGALLARIRPEEVGDEVLALLRG